MIIKTFTHLFKSISLTLVLVGFFFFLTKFSVNISNLTASFWNNCEFLFICSGSHSVFGLGGGILMIQSKPVMYSYES